MTKAIIVQKYGGTSVNTPERRNNIVRNVADAIKKGKAPVVVVSAMGRFPDAYSTDSLLGLVSVNTDILPRHKDLIASCGEIISCAVIAEQLRANGISAEALSGAQAGIRTDENFTDSEIIYIDTERIKALCEKGVVPVVAGFQGESENREVTTLGRGGSDTTAAALGDSLLAEAIEIYTDVDGVFVTDPKLVGNVKIIKTVNYSDVYTMASLGAKVIHPRAVSYAAAHNTPMYVLNVSRVRDELCTKICDGPSLIDGMDGFLAITLAKEEKQDRLCVMGNVPDMEAKVRYCSENSSDDCTLTQEHGVIILTFAPGKGEAFVEKIYNALM